MPLYFANQRHNIVKKGYGQTGRTEYMRSSPTQAIVLCDVQPNWVTSMLYTWMHAIFQAIWEPVPEEKRETETWGTELKGYFPHELKLQECLPFSVPRIAICFASNNIPLKVLEKVEGMGFTLQAMKNVRTPVYTKDYPTLQEAAQVMTIPGINAEFVPPYDYITPNAIGPLFKLIIGLSAITRISGVLLNSTHPTSHFVTLHLVGAEQRAQAAENEEMDEGEVQEELMDRVARHMADGDSMNLADVIRFDVNKERVFGSQYVPWGKVEDRPTRKQAVFCPFEPNYSQPDVNAISVLLGRFSRCFHTDDEDSTKELNALAHYWAREIATTGVGERMAHLIKGLDLATQCGGSFYPLFRPGGHYDGLVISGYGITFRKLGEEQVKGQSHAVIQTEMEQFGFHGVLLEKIVAACGIVAPIESITTLRRLRTLVMAGGMPSGAVKNEVSKYLSRLAFVEKPEGINPTSLGKVFNLLQSEEVIPDELYLHWEDFWSEDRMVLILSCWGRMVPSFFSGSVKIMACTMRGKNSAGAKEYSNMKPPMLQMKQKPIAVAVTDWKAMMQGGWIMTPDKNIQGGRVFRSQEGVHVWGELGKFLVKTVGRYNETLQEEIAEANVEKGKRRRPDDDAEGRENKRREFEFGGLELGSWD